jgi:hypothetical protein
MAEDKKTPIIIDDKEFMYEDLTDQQKIMVNHIADLDKKINTSQFNLDQLNVGKNAFITMLKESLNKVETE